jgi:lysophospholipase L1-like esterase
MLDIGLRLALSPVLLMQAVRVRSRALQLPEASGPREGISGSGPELSLVILGDSSAAGVGVDHQDQALTGQLTALLSQEFTLNWRLIAKTGATTGSTLKHLEGYTGSPVDVVVTALGVNDVTHAVPFAVWRKRQQALLMRIDQLFAPRILYMSGVPPLGQFPILPQPLRWTLGKQAARFDLALADSLRDETHRHHMPFDLPLNPTQMAIDGFHPGPEIYALWAKETASRIITDWPNISNRR